MRFVSVLNAPPRFDSTIDDFLIVIEFKWLFSLYRAWPKGPAPSGMPVCNLARYLSNAIEVASSLTVKMVDKCFIFHFRKFMFDHNCETGCNVSYQSLNAFNVVGFISGIKQKDNINLCTSSALTNDLRCSATI